MHRTFPILMTALVVALTGCRSSSTAGYSEAFQFAAPERVSLPESTSYAEKRGFADFNGDNIEDMVEIRDENWVGQDFHVYVYHGSFDPDVGVLTFSETPVEMALPIKFGWFSSATKIDTGDVNGDGYADIIFTEYKERMLGDSMEVAFALNVRGNRFEPYTAHVRSPGGGFGDRILSWDERHNRPADSSLYDYLKMDWGDMDGDGADDLVLAWQDYRALDLYVIYTEVDKSGQSIGIRSTGEDRIRGFMNGRSITEIDLEDFDGNGKQDIFMHRTRLGGDSFVATVALNTGNTNFNPHKDFVGVDTDMKLLAFEKYDTLDVTGDGCADFVHLGVYQSVKTMSYNAASCSVTLK